MEVVNALIRGTIDNRRGELILRALNAAIRNARRVRFADKLNMVTKVPDYPNPNPPNHDVGIQDLGSAFMEKLAQTPSHAATAASANTHVGTDAFVRPSGPEYRAAAHLNSLQNPTP